MKQLYNFILCMFLLSGASQLGAQDIHFSQFYMAPLTLNPAMTGVMNCNTRVIANYRNQWAAVLKNNAYNTYSVSYDQKVAVGRYDFFGFGANLWGDVAGSLDFQTLTAKLSGSYSKRVGGSRTSAHYIVFGAQAGVSQRSIDFLKAQWPEQVGDDFSFDPTMLSGETRPFDDTFLFGDVGAGLLWFSTFDENNSLYIGAAIEHLNQANLSFYTDEQVSYFTKTVIHAGGEFQATRGLSLVPGIVTFMQGPSFEVNGGTSLRFNLGGSPNSDQSFQVGAWIRIANHFEDPITMDAVILSTRFDFQQYGIGFSYDSNVSSLREASPSNGAFEFSLIYNICGPQRRGVYCPKF